MDVFRKARELDRTILPIRFDDSREAVETNLATRRSALTCLAQGGCIGIFSRRHSVHFAPAVRPPDGPGMAPFHRPPDRPLRRHGGAGVFRRAKQPALSDRQPPVTDTALRIADQRIPAAGRCPGARGHRGSGIARKKLDHLSADADALMDFLRQETYRLSPSPVGDLSYGFEPEDRKRNANRFF